jgi:hypothetical protein
MPVDDTKFACERVLFLKSAGFIAPKDLKTAFVAAGLTEAAM